MQKLSFVAIGHITEDLEPKKHLGGSVYYTALTSKKLGYPTTVITKAPRNHPYLKKLQDMGIKVYNLPTNLNILTSFRNFYNVFGRRTQFVTEKQDKINLEDLEKIPSRSLKNAIILIASVIGEVDQKLFPVLQKYGPVFVTLQGYLRSIRKDGKVLRHHPDNFDFLKSVQATIFSEEDIAGDLSILDSIRANSKITVMTLGEKGSVVFFEKDKIYSKAIKLKPNQIKDLTGAGDTFASAFVLEYVESGNLEKAGEKANLMAGLKISGK